MGVQALSNEETARRLPVWTALSELFLDQELQPENYRHMASVIEQSGYSIAEAEDMLRNEVAPAFAVNLWSLAGEWQGWPEDYVRKRVLEKRGSILARAASRLFNKALLESEWAKVAAFLDR